MPIPVTTGPGVRVTLGLSGVAPAVHQEVEAVVRDQAVRMHAAVVVRAHVPLRVVVGVEVLLGVGHVAEAVLGEQVDVLADVPVGGDRRVEAVLVGPELRGRAHHVGERLVQGAGLVLVDEVRQALGDAVTVLVGHDVQGARELPGDEPVAVAVHHVLAAPEGVVVVLVVVDDGRHVRVAAVRDPVEAVAGEVVPVGDLPVVLRVHHGRLAGRGAVGSDQRPVVVEVGRGIGEVDAVQRVVGLVPAVGREEVPVRPRRPVAGGVVERGDVVGGPRLSVEAGQALDVALHADPVVGFPAVVLAEDAPRGRVHPVEPPLERPPRLHPIEEEPGAGIDQEIDRVPAGAGVPRRDGPRLVRREPHGVGGRDADVPRADRGQGARRCRPAQERELSAEDGGGAEALLVALRHQAVGAERQRAHRGHVRGDLEVGRRLAGERVTLPGRVGLGPGGAREDGDQEPREKGPARHRIAS
jgi:hypothetical protein